MLRFNRGKLDSRDKLMFKTELEYESVLNLKELYKAIHEWCEEEGFITDPEANPKKLNYKEIFFWQRMNDAGMTDYHIWWRIMRYPGAPNAEVAYHRLFMRINMQMLAFSKKEILHEGKKVKLDKGDFILRIESWLQLDYQDKWKDSSFLKKLLWFWERKIYKSQLSTAKDDARDTAYRLQRRVKEFLELEQPFDQPKLFNPYKGYKHG